MVDLVGILVFGIISFFVGYDMAGGDGGSFSEKAKNYFMLNRDV